MLKSTTLRTSNTNAPVKTSFCAPSLLCMAIAATFSFAALPAFAGQVSTNIAVSNSLEKQSIGEHHQKKRIKTSERAPSVGNEINARRSYGAPLAANDVLARPSKQARNASTAQRLVKGKLATAAAACDVNLFASSSGTALVNAVKASTTECVNQLFNVTGAQAGNVFNEAKMVTIADALRANSQSYNGTNAASTLQLVLFLRAGYYVNYYNSGDTGAYTAKLKSSIQGALDAFSSNANFGLVNDVHGEVLAEVVILVDSATENARYLNAIVKRLLNSYNSTYNSYYWMSTAVNNTFSVLFRGHQNADFKALVQGDTSIVDTLYNFVNNNFSQLGGSYGYLVANAGREEGRFLQYANGTSLKTLAQSRAKAMIDRSNVTGSTAALWVGVGEMIDYYDKANCSYYNLCDFTQRLESNVLPISHSCSPTLRLRAQALTAAQLSETCSTVLAEETYFHNQLATNKVPVPNDKNTQLEMVVFKSSADYGTYAGAIYGIDTNNGGMYLEGDPSATGNQARFIAYQAEWKLPAFEIWNLTHEYIHYLDGRFNMSGDFAAAMSTNTVWWVEGFAEYMSYSYRNLDYTSARTQAGLATYDLSTIFNNDYNSGQTRVYNWGYLAVRYMFEKQRAKVNNVLGYFRPGNYTDYTAYMKSGSMSSSMDADFKAWLPCVANPSNPGCNTGNALPVASFSRSISGLTVNFADTSTDSDGTISSRAWSFGDGSSSTSTNPSKTFASAGTYNVSLTVTDNAGGKATTSQSVTVSATPSNSLPVANFSKSISGMTVSFTDTSTDADGTISTRLWNFGDGTTSSAINPVKRYTTPGTYTVTLSVTDNLGGKTSTSQTVVISSGSTLPECPSPSNALGKNCVRSNINVPLNDYAYMYLYVPAGTSSVRITSSGGTGSVDMYGNTLGQWATKTANNYRSTNSGNSETITFSNPPAGYMYVSLYGVSAATGVSMKAEF